TCQFRRLYNRAVEKLSSNRLMQPQNLSHLFIPAFPPPRRNRGAYFSQHLRANDDRMILPCRVTVFRHNLFTSSSYPFPSLSSTVSSAPFSDWTDKPL